MYFFGITLSSSAEYKLLKIFTINDSSDSMKYGDEGFVEGKTRKICLHAPFPNPHSQLFTGMCYFSFYLY